MSEEKSKARALLEDTDMWGNIWNKDVTLEVWLPILKALKLLENEKVYEEWDEIYSQYNNQGKSIGKILTFLFLEKLEKLQKENEKLKELLQEENIELRYRQTKGLER